MENSLGKGIEGKVLILLLLKALQRKTGERMVTIEKKDLEVLEAVYITGKECSQGRKGVSLTLYRFGLEDAI